MRIAIIGSGIAGNVAAYHLHKDHDITLFEANDYVGGHTHTHTIAWKEKEYSIDTGFIVFNYLTYPHFTHLLKQLEVPVQPSNMSFSVKCEKSGLEYNGNNLNSLFAQRSNLFRPSFHRMLRDIMRFNRHAPTLLENCDDKLSLAAYLQQQAYGREFIEHYIIPMGAAIWSTDPQRMHAFPAHSFVRFFHNHGLLSISDRPTWYVIKGGSSEYVNRLIRPFRDRIRLNSPVERIQRFPTHVAITPRNQPTEHFDAVFIASHSDQALAMLSDATRQEQEILGAIPYQENTAILHTDQSILPKRRLAWAAWNYHLLQKNSSRVVLTYNMNILQGLNAPEQFCVTLNNDNAIAESRIIKHLRYHHPVYTPKGMQAQQHQEEINGTNRTYFCGAYWRYGFHEDGVVSALNAIKHFNEYQHAQLHLRRAS
jgi:predicted NAD/FAD-binding protein